MFVIKGHPGPSKGMRVPGLGSESGAVYTRFGAYSIQTKMGKLISKHILLLLLLLCCFIM